MKILRTILLCLSLASVAQAMLSPNPYFPIRSQLGGGAGSHFGVGTSQSTVSTLALNSSFIFGTQGVAVAQDLTLESNMTLTDFWFVCVSKTGTGSTDGNINWEIREGFGSINYKPGSTVVASGTVACSALTASSWYKVTLSTPQPLTAHTHYSLLLFDADGDATNYTTIVQNIRNSNNTRLSGGTYYTANGFNTAGTANSYTLPCAFKMSSGLVFGGSIYANSTNFPNSPRFRGIRLTLDADQPPLKLATMGWAPGVGGWTVKVYTGLTARPNDSPTYQWTIPTTYNYTGTQMYAAMPIPDFTAILRPGETYYIGYVPVGSSGLPARSTSYSGMDSDLKKLLAGYEGMSAASVQDDGANGWSVWDDSLPLWGPNFVIDTTKPTIAH